MSTSTNFQAQEAFREERRQYIGGSDIAALFNLPPYGCALKLFKDKTGVKPDFTFYGNDHTERGTILEPIAAAKFSANTGWQVRRSVPRPDPVLPFLRPQPDYDIINAPRGKELGTGTLSIKCPSSEAYRKIKQAITAYTAGEPKTEWEKKLRDEGKKALFGYELQLHIETAAQNRDWGAFTAFNADGWQECHAILDRDDEIIATIRDAAAKFWSDKAQLIEPAKLDASSRQCKDCPYRISCQSDQLLKLLQHEEGDDSKAVLPVLAQLDALVIDLREQEALFVDAKELVDGTKERIRGTLAEAGVDAAKSDFSTVYNRLQKGRETLQKAPMLKAFAGYAKQAEKVLKLAEKGDIVLVDSVKECIELLATLDDVVRDKFISVGAAYRTLKVYDRLKKFDQAADAAGATVATTQVQ